MNAENMLQYVMTKLESHSLDGASNVETDRRNMVAKVSNMTVLQPELVCMQLCCKSYE